MKGLKILIADDHKLVRTGIRFTIESSNAKGTLAKFDEASNGYEALQLATVNEYDIILMDINMPEMDGIAATHEILKNTPNKNIIAISMHDEEYQVRKMIEAGARGYLLKNTGPEILNAAIQTVIRGGQYFSNEVAVKLMHIAGKRESSEPLTRSSQKIPLSKREQEILTMIANELTNEEIAEKLSLSKRTVDTHRQNMINKLQVKNTAGLIKYAIQNNLI
ncbi:MAG: response regulator transcription factor [Bacteroidetes bacterium]|nr:response regulator transcription factor [Bacteroidota bacterium]